MKEFPSMPSWKDHSKIPFGSACYGFEKFDGSNLRWEWSRKKGFYKFGTRHRLFSPDEEPWKQAIPIFFARDFGQVIEDYVTDEHKGIQEFTVYTEFFGSSSFAGTHVNEEQKKLMLLDIWIHRKGFIHPKQMVKDLGNNPWVPPIIYQGNLNRELVNSVVNGTFETPLNEGMVCKGTDRRGMVWMVKIKTEKFLERLKSYYGADWKKYE